MKKLASRIALIRASQGGDESVSNALANEYANYLRSKGHELDEVDLSNVPYVDEWDEDYSNAEQARMRGVDAAVFASPVYNWGPSARMNAYMQNAIKSGQNDYLPYTVLGAAGSPRATMALGQIGQSMGMESKGIGIGAPIVGTGGDVLYRGDRVTGVSKSMQKRLQENADMLAMVAQARRGSEKLASFCTRFFIKGANKIENTY